MHTNHVIIIDDDAISNMICKSVVGRYFRDAEIQLFTQPEIALDTISKNPFYDWSTLIFLDVNMPTMSGWDFLEIFATLDETLRSCFSIYILSSSVDDSDRLRASANQYVMGFLMKPISTEALSRVFKLP